MKAIDHIVGNIGNSIWMVRLVDGPDDSAFHNIDYDVGVGWFGDSGHNVASTILIFIMMPVLIMIIGNFNGTDMYQFR